MRTSPNIGVVSDDIDKLASRLWVSGLEVVPRHQAVARGFHNRVPGVVAAREWRRATADQAYAFQAGGDTPHRLQLIELPAAVGEAALSRYTRRPGDPLPDPRTREDLVHGLSAAVLEITHDLPCQANASVDISLEPCGSDGATALYPYVGFHINKWPPALANMLYTVANTGPGSMLVGVVPELSSDSIHATDPGNWAVDMIAHLQNHPDPSSILSYGVELRPPHDGVVEAVAGVPSARFAHDIATWGSPLGTSAIIAATDPVPIGAFPSPIWH